MSAPQNTIALIFDFDDTLTDDLGALLRVAVQGICYALDVRTRTA